MVEFIFERRYMKCTKCKTEMVERSGKFGKFLCCPKSNPTDNHGTISLEKRAVVGQDIYNDRFHSSMFSRDSLDMEIHRQMMGFGVRMTDLDLFIEGGPEAAEDETDHWMNMRDY